MMTTGVRLDGMKVGTKPVTIPQTHFSVGSFDIGAMNSRERCDGRKRNLYTGTAVNTFPLNFGPDGVVDERSIERPGASAFLMVESSSFKVTMKVVCADL